MQDVVFWLGALAFLALGVFLMWPADPNTTCYDLCEPYEAEFDMEGHCTCTNTLLDEATRKVVEAKRKTR
jgi:hypothetical protein